ncbi:hypothetical protein TNCV_818921 [Trichonephila clavipes]|nr:hypothetical protein TNCV_818921 [Trichonephila clavipes]
MVYRSISVSVRRDSITFSRIWNRCIQDGNMEHRAGSQRPLAEKTSILSYGLNGSSSHVLSKEVGSFVRQQVSARTVQRCPPHSILCDHAQSGCENCSQASVVGTKKLLYAVAQDVLDTINSEPGALRLLTIPGMKMPFKESCFQSRDEIMQNEVVKLNTILKSLPDVFSTVEGMLG